MAARARRGRGCWPALWVLGALLLAGCAQRAGQVAPSPPAEAEYLGWDCERLFDERDAVQRRAADLAYDVDARAGRNMVALGLGLTVFWPALIAMRPDGPEAALLAELKGRDDLLGRRLAQRGCGAPPGTMSPARAARLPLVLGERLVYDERQGPVQPGLFNGNGRAGQAPQGPQGALPPERLVTLTLTALRRDRLEFRAERGGRALPGQWQQDLSGNVLPEGASPLLQWRRLLRPGLELGQVLSGELRAGEDGGRVASVRGQVVAVGPQRFDGRNFDVAVIELYGEVQRPLGSDQGGGRLDGVMAVDRVSGIVIRVDLQSGLPEFSLRRRLLRIEAAEPR